MSKQYSFQQIRRYWTQQAKLHGLSPASSWSDKMVIEMEIKEIKNRLSDGDRILDVGCGSGYSTVRWAAEKRVSIRGLDPVPEMVENARRRLTELPFKPKGQVRFSPGNILELKEPSSTYDKVIAVRVLINLKDWNHQWKALRECIRVLKFGGQLFLSEATLQGWQQLNLFRREWGLADIPMPPFNQYLDQEQVIRAVQPELKLIELANFASTYYVGTRVLKPLFIQALNAPIDAGNPLTNWNRWFSMLPAWGDYGTQKLFHFQKIRNASKKKLGRKNP